MTEREKNGERLAMKISRHRQAKHEAIQYEDVKTAYIKGCEDTEKENADLPAIAYQQGAEAYKKKADAKLERAREIIGELQGILDKDICKDCDGGLHCSECYVNHAITTAGTFLEEYKK